LKAVSHSLTVVVQKYVTYLLVGTVQMIIDDDG